MTTSLSYRPTAAAWRTYRKTGSELPSLLYSRTAAAEGPTARPEQDIQRYRPATRELRCGRAHASLDGDWMVSRLQIIGVDALKVIEEPQLSIEHPG